MLTVPKPHPKEFRDEQAIRRKIKDLEAAGYHITWQPAPV